MKKLPMIWIFNRRYCFYFYLIFWLFFCFLALAPFYSYGGPENFGSNSAVVFNATDIMGKKITTQNSTASMILFFDPGNTNQKLMISYARILYDKYHSKGLMIVGVSSSDKKTVIEFSKSGRITFPLISDPENRVFEKFKMKNCCGGVVVLDKKGMVKFILSTIIDKVTMRQLVEKELLGKIEYNFNDSPKSEAFKLNNPAPLISLQEVSSNEILNFNTFGEDYIVATFFSSMCATCKTGRRITMMKDIERELQNNHIQAKSVLVFFRPFDKYDIEKWGKVIDLPFDQFIADDLFSNEERYVTDDSIVPDPFTVVLNKKRNVIFVEEVKELESDLAAAVLKIIKSQSLVSIL